jgi:glycosyltransferase involved in cell wall biosynthesis
VISSPVPPDWPLQCVDGVFQARRDRVVLFVGRLHPVKGLAPLLEAWARVWPSFRDWRLVFVGHGGPGSWKERSRSLLSGSADQSLEFSGSKDRSDLLEVYDRASVFVLPSFTEVIGLANLEAAARGLPIITSCKAGLDALAEYRGGLTVRPRAADVADALTSLIAMPDAERRAMGARALQMVQDRFTWGSIAPAFERLYTGVLGGGAA